MHHPIIRVTVSIRTSEYAQAGVLVTEERNVPIVEIDPKTGPLEEQWHLLARVLEEYAERAVTEAQGQARELADNAPREATEPAA